MIRQLFNSLCPPQRHPFALAEKKLESSSRGQVMQGPFKGMRYGRESVGSAYHPKLMGTYERELHRFIEKLCQQPFQSIVDVGAAEGYYAVGMARRFPNARVMAFESQVKGRELLEAMARANGVQDRITIKGHCEVADLRQVVAPQSLVIMDVEGAEMLLLNPDAVPALGSCTVLVELHDCFEPGISRRIEERFKATHHIETIRQRKRWVSDLPLRAPLLNRWLLQMTNEFRAEKMSWFLMTPR